MKSSHRMAMAVFLSFTLAAACAWSAARADTGEDLAQQQERQQQIRAETDTLVRRLGTMLRVLEYYQLDKTGERKMLEEMTGVLSGLSKNQMNEVIRRLEAAASSKNEAAADKEVLAAYDRHREILDALKGILSRHDAIRNLDDTADRLEQFAKDQLGLHLQTSQLTQDSLDEANPNLPTKLRFPLNKRRNPSLELKRQADAQTEVHRDVERVVRQVLDLRGKLPEEQKDRVERMRKLAAEHRLLDSLAVAAQKLKINGGPIQRLAVLKEVNETQWQAAGQIQELARALRALSERAAILREARDRIDQAIIKQDELNQITKDSPKGKEPEANPKDAVKPQLVFPDTVPLPRVTPLDRKAALEQAAQEMVKSQELSKQQARVQYDTTDTASLVKPHVEELAAKIDKAGQAMKDARAAMVKYQLKDAVQPQEKASNALKEVRTELDKLIAAAEKEKNDPLAALKKAADDVEKLIQDQTETRAKTKESVDAARKIPALAKNQQDLANRTEQLKDTPLPAKEEAKTALDNAAKAMTQAAKALEKQHAENALPKQQQALAALAQAKKEIGAKIAELEKRRDDFAQLEDAAKKLGELAQAEEKIADKANDMVAKSEPTGTKDLANTQEKLTPETKDVAKNLQAAAPDAANKVSDAAKDMDAAKKELDKNQAKPAAGLAKEAAKKLDDARADIAKALAEMKAKDIADQAAMQPSKIDPQAVAQQIAKALEQTEKAATEAKQAELLALGEQKDALGELERQKPQKLQPDLVRLQQNIAKQADAMALDAAAKDAAKAADALRQGAIQKAIPNQENALDKLQEAAKRPMPPAEPKSDVPVVAKAGPLAGEAKPFQTKDGDPKAVQLKTNLTQTGENKNITSAGEAKASESKTGAAQAGTKPAKAKANQAQAAEVKGAPPNPGEAKAIKAGNAKASPPKASETKQGMPKTGAPKAEQLQAKASSSKKSGLAKAGQTKDAQAKAGQAKSGQALSGESKLAQAQTAASKMGQGTQAQAKAGSPGMVEGKPAQPEQAQAKAAEGPPLPQAKNAAELAQAQKEVMDATKALTQSQDSTQAAMNALGQAQAQAPQAIQQQLESAGQQLAKANQNLQKGLPAQAGQKQNQAAKELSDVLKAMNAALAGMKPQQEPGQSPTAQAKAEEPGQPGQDTKEGKEGQGKKPGQGKGKQPGPGQEKNEPKGNGERIADGKTSNAKSQLTESNGDGSFLHLPPRQRELIRQALSGQLPPEYAAMIQQYYINIARGRAAPGAVPPLNR